MPSGSHALGTTLSLPLLHTPRQGIVTIIMVPPSGGGDGAHYGGHAHERASKLIT